MGEPAGRVLEVMGHADTTRDAFFGGRLHLLQPLKGHRSGTDAVLLAAAIPEQASGLCYDMGAGVGAAGLGAALVRPNVTAILVEKDAATCDLAQANALASGLGQRATATLCDILDRAERRARLAEPAAFVITNPPFHDAGAVRLSPDAGRRSAHVLASDVTLADWLAACLDRLSPGGTLIAIHAAEALPRMLAALDGKGALTVKPVLSRAGDPARRVLVRLTRGSRAPFVLAAPLVLHEGGRFTAESEAVHRGEAFLAW